MSEFTRIINLQITFIDEKEIDEDKETLINKIKDYIKEKLEADDVKVSSIKEFELPKE